MIVDSILTLTYSYIAKHFAEDEIGSICNEVLAIAQVKDYSFSVTPDSINLSYEELQDILSKYNEKESIRKDKGVFYTPNDVVRFILINSVKALYGKLTSSNINDIDSHEIPWKSFATSKKVFDPTCGAGEFLITALQMKLDMVDSHCNSVSKAMLIKVVSTISGNDINPTSIMIAKIRIYLHLLQRYGARKTAGISQTLNNSFTTLDYVSDSSSLGKMYDIIVGNPPYVEDSKSGLQPTVKYGNIYANVISNAAGHLHDGGSMGFVIPLSHISTPRMSKLRERLSVALREQYIMSYADRPDCLFDSVHQKLCILIGRKVKAPYVVHTGNYQYWYKNEREFLFQRAQVIKNDYVSKDFIPKLGNKMDVSIYKKVIGVSKKTIYSISRKGQENVYLNRRETFWMKAYRETVADPEYKVFSFASSGEADYCYCLINSSIFWWYWITVSDCWHVSKELNGFRAPEISDYSRAIHLAAALYRQLETTKVYVGTKQTDFEYKHRDCIREIHEIDDYINALFGLNDEESEYIKHFAFKYRTSGGAGKHEGN